MHTVSRLLPELTFGLGESPVWDNRTGHLYWVDIKAPACTVLTHKPVRTGWPIPFLRWLMICA